jgi:hypothetical protein
MEPGGFLGSAFSSKRDSIQAIVLKGLFLLLPFHATAMFPRSEVVRSEWGEENLTSWLALQLVLHRSFDIWNKKGLVKLGERLY